MDEPNNSEDEPAFLDNITDADANGNTIKSILAGEDDVDWFAYEGIDALGARNITFKYVDPFGGLSADEDLRLCLFVECISGNTIPFDCIDSTYDETPDNTFPGCCSTSATAAIIIDLHCDAGDDEGAIVLMRVDGGEAGVCVPYEISYHF